MNEEEALQAMHCDVAIHVSMRDGQREVGVASRQRCHRQSKSTGYDWTINMYRFVDNQLFVSVEALLVRLMPHNVFLGKVRLVTKDWLNS